MQTPESQIIIQRFFEAIQHLKSDKRIRGKQTFCNRYGINRRNWYQLEMNLEKDIFQVSWLAYLVNDYDVSALWLLTGSGEFYRRKPE